MAEAATSETANDLSKEISGINIKNSDGEEDGKVDSATLSLMRKLTRSKLLQSRNEIKITRNDPKSLLHSIKSFEELQISQDLLKGIYKMGFSAPSKIQETVLPILLTNPPPNLIAQSQSGTGKTAAFILASLARVDENQAHPQVLILSPTYELALQTATYEDAVMEFAEMIVSNPIVIRLRREEESLENIDQFYIECSNDIDKYKALANLFGTLSVGQVFIFCQTKKSAAWLADKLTKDGHAVGLITGDLSVEERTNIINRFRDGLERVLIATNLMARGIDVEQVTVVINYDLPVDYSSKEIDYETYLHRIGRTGRFGKAGLAFNMVDSRHTLDMIRKLEEHYGRKIERLDANDFEKLEELNRD